MSYLFWFFFQSGDIETSLDYLMDNLEESVNKFEKLDYSKLTGRNVNRLRALYTRLGIIVNKVS